MRFSCFYSLTLETQFIYIGSGAGVSLLAAFVLNAGTASMLVWYIVCRTKLCLDFIVTVHVVHLFACWVYSGAFPSTLSWWSANFVCAGIMTVCAEYLCMMTELKEIPLQNLSKTDT